MGTLSYFKVTQDGPRTVTVEPVADGLRVTASDSGGALARPVRLVTSRPGDYARSIADDLTASGYSGDAA